MRFFLGCLFAIWLGRMIGWTVSRVLYSSGWGLCAVVCILWGIGLAYGLRLAILAAHPGLLLKMFGYGAGTYISIPNYGLIEESTIRDYQMYRHVLIKGVPLVLFIITSLVFAFAV